MNEKEISLQKDFIKGREPKILCLDLEISPMLAYTYEAYEGNVLKIKVQPQIVSFAYSWQNEKQIHVRSLPDYPGYTPGILKLDDKKIVTELHEIMHKADMIYGHNIRAFDLKHARARFLVHNLKVSKKWITEDTLIIARKYFKFPKNNLNEITEVLGIGTKTKVKHSDVIWDCIDGDMKAWEAMQAYVKQDIVITKSLYSRIAPWHETHYNLNLFRRKGNSCTLCGSTHVHSEGPRYNKFTISERFSCLKCGHYWTSGVIARAPRQEPPNAETEPVLQSNV